ncbi:MAG TPA: cation diffusion facilitator family transporter [Actinomycetota bacterium]|nr:cation diffusion facilitator family transporter [Actinomycetota bacterium]
MITDPRQRAALGALVITLGLTAAKVIVGLATSSLVVLAQAVDSAIDIIAIGLVFFALRVADRPPDESHHYGHGKAENLVAFAQTMLLGAIVLGLAVEAMRRLGGEAHAVDAPGYAIALVVVSIVVDVIRIRWLTKVAGTHSSEALRASALNFATDVGTAAIALVSLLSVRGGSERADSIGALLVVVAVSIAAFRLGKRSVDVLMDRAPETRMRDIEAAAAGAPGVAEARRVRVRTSGKQLFADVTVAAGRTASLERAHDIAEGVEREIHRIAPGTDVVVHVEPTDETDSLIERAQAAASRVEDVHEIHNVSVHAFEDGTRLHVTLHAKSGTASVEEAHELADRIEAAVRGELGATTRVDTHIEPLEHTSLGRDVTSERQDIVRSLQDLAAAERDTLYCHEVIVTSSTAGLAVIAHVRGRGSLSLTRLHDASARVESRLMSKHPDVASVLIHFEPG